MMREALHVPLATPAVSHLDGRRSRLASIVWGYTVSNRTIAPSSVGVLRVANGFDDDLITFGDHVVFAEVHHQLFSAQPAGHQPYDRSFPFT
ncbi:MAG: hypothetical protein JRG89_02290 [Deltaproteobacteria bacterium]|nr:hypothetical protein [Deltaproteobacteria bacterium]MBW2387242.1 hypothetical protein [Deltaproteobacteria bacterium]